MVPTVKVCRICSSSEVIRVGSYRPYLDLEFVVFDCAECGCRFTRGDESVYEKMHWSKHSPYCSHIYAADKAWEYFEKGPIHLRKYLLKTTKNRFVIGAIESEINIRSILEVGCSRGYLTSYFILRDYNVLGIDLSESAIRSAVRAFGDHFAVAGRENLSSMAPFDAIYHVGTIGCVESPIDLTYELLSLLRSGGVLFFNAPDRRACVEMGEIWLAGTAPPDSVTLFSREFWPKHFGHLADVSVTCEPFDGYGNAIKVFRRLLGRPYLKAARVNFLENDEALGTGSIKHWVPGPLRDMVKSGIAAIGSSRVFPRYSAEFGIYVTMRKK